MNANLRIVARTDDRYPEEEFIPDLIDFDYFARFIDRESHICRLYQNWFQREIMDNRFFMFNVFIRKVPHAVSLFEKIINSDDFFKYIICQIKEFTPMRNIIDDTGFNIIKHPDYFTECLIIPREWKILSLMYDHDYIQQRREIFNDSAIDFFIKCDQDYIQSIRKKYPIEINFSDDFIQLVKCHELL